MRRSVAVLLFTCAFLGLSAAQPLRVETFDRSGLPAHARTDSERELLRRLSVHRAGDVADAVEIQRQLAAYYRANGDDERARAAEERVNAAVPGLDKTTAPGRPYGGTQPLPSPGIAAPLPGRNQVSPGRGVIRDHGGWGAPGYGGIAIPGPARRPDETKPPSYGPPVALPAEAPQSAIPVYAGDDAAAAKKDGGVPPVYPTGATGAPAPAGQEPTPAPAPADMNPGAPLPGASQAFEFTGRFYALQGPTLHTWDFRPDGTFEHAWMARNASPETGNFEAGAFRAAGPYLILTILRGSGSGASVGRSVRQLPFRVLAPGSDGFMLGGMMLGRKALSGQYH